MHHFVRDCTHAAMRYGVETDNLVMRFVAFTVDLGIDFDIDPKYPWAFETLCDAALSAEEKMVVLSEKSEEYFGENSRQSE